MREPYHYNERLSRECRFRRVSITVWYTTLCQPRTLLSADIYCKQKKYITFLWCKALHLSQQLLMASKNVTINCYLICFHVSPSRDVLVANAMWLLAQVISSRPDTSNIWPTKPCLIKPWRAHFTRNGVKWENTFTWFIVWDGLMAYCVGWIYGLMCGMDLWLIVWDGFMAYCVGWIYGLLCGMDLWLIVWDGYSHNSKWIGLFNWSIDCIFV